MLGAGVDVQLPDHLLAQPVLGQHAPHRAADDLFGPAEQESLDRLRAQAARLSPRRAVAFVAPRSCSYRTDTRHRPLAVALGPAFPRSREATISANAALSIFPRPTQRSVPTMARTMPRRNASAVISKRTSELSEQHSALRIVRTPPGPAANAEKSFRPTSAVLASRIAATSNAVSTWCSRSRSSGSRSSAFRTRYSYFRPVAGTRA